MNIKKCMLLLCILGVLTILTPIDAFTIHKTDNDMVYYSNGKSVLTIAIYSKIGTDYEMKKDLDQIDKITIKINNKTIKTINKNKGWNRYKYYPFGILERKVIVNSNISGKYMTIQTYSNDKLIKSRTDKIQSLQKKPSISSKEEATASARSILKNSYDLFKGKPELKNLKVTNVTYIVKDKVWYASFVNTKTGKRVGYTYIDDKTGKITTGYGHGYEFE